MPNPDFSAIARWPNVPACYGWLSLDRRGRWRLQGETLDHAGLNDFISRQYMVGDDGRCFMQNGPQRVYVDLEYTPWVLRLQPDGSVVAHTGEAAGAVAAAFVDEEGNVLLQTALGIGLLDDRDLQDFVGGCSGELPLPEAPPAAATWRGLPVTAIRRGEVAARFGYVGEPRG